MDFWVEQEYIAGFALHQVRGAEHLEYWIPAEDLEEFNHNIVSAIAIVREFHCALDGKLDSFENDLDELVRSFIPRDTDPNYTEYFVGHAKQGLRAATSVTLSGNTPYPAGAPPTSMPPGDHLSQPRSSRRSRGLDNGPSFIEASCRPLGSRSPADLLCRHFATQLGTVDASGSSEREV